MVVVYSFYQWLGNCRRSHYQLYFSSEWAAIPILFVFIMFRDETDDSNFTDNLSTCNRCGNYTHGTCSCILNSYNEEEDIQAQEYCSICDGWCDIHDVQKLL